MMEPAPNYWSTAIVSVSFLVWGLMLVGAAIYRTYLVYRGSSPEKYQDRFHLPESSVEGEESSDRLSRDSV